MNPFIVMKDVEAYYGFPDGTICDVTLVPFEDRKEAYLCRCVAVLLLRGVYDMSNRDTAEYLNISQNQATHYFTHGGKRLMKDKEFRNEVNYLIRQTKKRCINDSNCV